MLQLGIFCAQKISCAAVRSFLIPSTLTTEVHIVDGITQMACISFPSLHDELFSILDVVCDSVLHFHECAFDIVRHCCQKYD